MWKRWLAPNKNAKAKNDTPDQVVSQPLEITHEPFDDIHGLDEKKGIQDVSDRTNLCNCVSEGFDTTNPFKEESNNLYKTELPPLTTSEESDVDGEYPPIWYTKRSDLLPFGDGSNKVYGFENFGNTCYCNSVLQCLYNHSEFRIAILKYPVRESDERERKTDVIGNKPKRFDTILSELNNNRKNPNGNSSNDSGSRVNVVEDISFSQQTKKRFPGFSRPSKSNNDSINNNDIPNTSQEVKFTFAPQMEAEQVKSSNHSESQVTSNASSRVIIVGRELHSSISRIEPTQSLKSKVIMNSSTSTTIKENEIIMNDEHDITDGTTNSDEGTLRKVESPSHGHNIERRKKIALLNGPILNIDHKITEHNIKSNLYGTLKDIFECITENKHLTGIVSPEKFINTFKKENVLFSSMMHQDAHEFLNLLLNHISDTVSTASTETESKNFVEALFQGTITYRVKCLTCDNITIRDEPFLDFPIEVQNSEDTDIQKILKSYHQREMLNGTNKFYCDLCCGLQEAERIVGLKQLPKTLSLHLKRFKYSETDNANIKLFNRIHYPLDLNVCSTFDPNVSKSYTLSSLVIHLGGGPQHGHYISICKTDKYGWLLFDDETVETIQEEDVLKFTGDPKSMSTAYVLMYTENTAIGEDNVAIDNRHMENVSELMHADNILRKRFFNKSNIDDNVHSQTNSTVDILGTGNEERSFSSISKIGDKTSKFFSFRKKQG